MVRNSWIQGGACGQRCINQPDKKDHTPQTKTNHLNYVALFEDDLNS